MYFGIFKIDEKITIRKKIRELSQTRDSMNLSFDLLSDKKQEEEF